MRDRTKRLNKLAVILRQSSLKQLTYAAVSIKKYAAKTPCNTDLDCKSLGINWQCTGVNPPHCEEDKNTQQNQGSGSGSGGSGSGSGSGSSGGSGSGSGSGSSGGSGSGSGSGSSGGSGSGSSGGSGSGSSGGSGSGSSSSSGSGPRAGSSAPSTKQRSWMSLTPEEALMGGSRGSGPRGSSEEVESDIDESDIDESNLISKSLKKGDRGADVRRLQRALVSAGFTLPKYGVDGKFGSETARAVKAFKEEAKRRGVSDTKRGSVVTPKLLAVLESREYAGREPRQMASAPRESERRDLSGTSEQGILYVGDSQMRLGFGSALISATGGGMRVAVGGKNARYFANSQSLKEQLQKRPSKIYVALGGNGIDGTDELISFIKRYAGDDVSVTWFGCPPPLKRDPNAQGWPQYLTTVSGFTRDYDRRVSRNADMKAKVEAAGWVFINPFDYLKYDSPIVVNGRRFTSGYTCVGCDGIHLPRSVARDYVSSALSRASS